MRERATNRRSVVWVWLALALWGCGSSGDAEPPAARAGSDGSSDTTTTSADTAGADTPAAVDAGSAVDAASAPDVVEAPLGLCPASFRAIGGVSMGAAALNIALANPGEFGIIGALGGYPSFEYMVSAGLRLHLAGFCPLEDLLAADDLNDPGAEPPVFCGPVQPLFEGEFVQDFNHLHFDDSGTTFSRHFYIKVFRSLTLAFGNFTSEPTGVSPYLPAGLTLEWKDLGDAERCQAPTPIPASLAVNAEYNPDGSFPVIPLCEAEDPVTPGLGGADFDPAAVPDDPSEILLAVDLNGNGRRDFGEPLFLNPYERFEDVGADGCASAQEDGLGGCLPEPAAGGDDPNGDDYHWWSNPSGHERNGRMDDGEPYADYGLDGVADTSDAGEGNGEFDTTTAFDRVTAFDAVRRLEALPDADLAGAQIYLEAGIRDALHARVAIRQVAAVLRARGADIQHYAGLAGRPGALVESIPPEELIGQLGAANLTEDVVGRHVLVEYGDPNASPELIEEGDGKHVGTIPQALNRLLMFAGWALSRVPEPDTEPISSFPAIQEHTFYSAAMGSRRRYLVAVPPGYEASGTDYPTLYLLHGLGMDPGDLSAASILTIAMMSSGRAPKAIQVFVDGTCCELHAPTGRRECACRPAGKDTVECVDPTCTGPEDECDVYELPKSELQAECLGGSLYLDLVADRWGRPRTDMDYAASVMDLVAHVEATYRTRSGALARDGEQCTQDSR